MSVLEHLPASARRKVLEQMRADWNRRAEEDVNYFVAFARRCQNDDEFFSTGAPVVWAFEKELKWILPRLRGTAPRALARHRPQSPPAGRPRPIGLAGLVGP